MKRESVPAWIGLVFLSGWLGATPAKAEFQDEFTGGPPPFQVVDRFNRSLNGVGLNLVDWEGYIANPSIRIGTRVTFPLTPPVKVEVHSDTPLVYFSLPSKVSDDGASKTVTIDNLDANVWTDVALWPSRDSRSGEARITFTYCDALSHCGEYRLPVHVLGQGDPGVSHDDQSAFAMSPFPFIRQPDGHPFVEPPFPLFSEPKKLESDHFTIGLDFNQNDNDFYDDPDFRHEVRQAAEDWSYFFEPPTIDEVSPGQEQTSIYDLDKDGKQKEIRRAPNRLTFRGLLVYFTMSKNRYTFKPADPKSGKAADQRMGGTYLWGAESDFGTIPGLPMGMHRSAQIILCQDGAGHGYYKMPEERDWWKVKYTDADPVDLYSVASHELGHMLIFDTRFNWIAYWEKLKKITERNVTYYYGADLPFNDEWHLSDDIDPTSLVPAFGTTVFGTLPRGRWLPTKLDLSVARALGYRLRDLSPFRALQLENRNLSEAAVGQDYDDGLSASGGVPTYYWSIDAGELPAGLSIDSFSGHITGQAKTVGYYSFVVTLHDSDENQEPLSRALQIIVK